MEFEQKLKKLKRLIIKYKANQIVLQSKDPNFYWLIQQKVEKAILIITKKETILLIKSLEYVPWEIKTKIKVIPFKKSKDITKIIKQLIHGKTLINYDETTLLDKEILNIKKTKNIMQDLQNFREIKTNNEIIKIKKACTHTVKCWKLLLNKIKNKEFREEKQIDAEIKRYALQNNLELAFNPIVASGKNAGVPHHTPQKTLKKGFLIIDFGFEYEGYKSDMTRTIYLGNPSKQEKQIYDELLKIQEEIIQELKPKINVNKLYKKTLKLMNDKKDLFIHGLGHGVGVYIHELPSITNNSKDKVKKDQILTIEPGYYTKKYGIRIEDTILIKEKPIILTRKASKKLEIIR